MARGLQTLRDISAELAQRGIFNERGQPFSAASINSMSVNAQLRERDNEVALMLADEYALEKLRQAVGALATGSGRVQERLADAAVFLIRVRREDIADHQGGGELIGSHPGL